MQEEEFEKVEYKDINLIDLVHVSNNINYFMINIKDEQIQNLVDRLEKLELIGENVFSCPKGHFEWHAMPFGLKNEPSIF